MSTTSTLTAVIQADGTLQVNVKQSDEVTPQTMTGFALTFRFYRASDDALVFSKTTVSGIAIGNGSGTNDRATVTVLAADTRGWPAGRDYSWSLWREDSGSSIPLADGPGVLQKKKPAS